MKMKALRNVSWQLFSRQRYASASCLIVSKPSSIKLNCLLLLHLRVVTYNHVAEPARRLHRPACTTAYLNG